MRMNFDPFCLRGLLLLEGVKETDIPEDHGGLTGYSGITDEEWQNYLSRHAQKSRPLSTMTPAEAADLLLENYWEPGGCDLLPSGLDFVHFAWCVNHGLDANYHLQASAEAWQDDGTEDGVIGDLTAAKVRTWEVNLPMLNPWIVITERYLAIQGAKYDEIERNNLSQLKFLRGWKNRIIRTREIIAGRPLSV